MPATPYILDSTEIYTAILLIGTANEISIMPPEKIAAAPAPATTRPRMKIEEEGARAQMRDPASKQRSAKMMTLRRGR
jgi:hypothetical protein